MTKILCVVILILCASQCLAETVAPEVATPINLSDHDLNRLVCNNGAIRDVYYSKEKAVTVTIDKNNAYVKFLVKRKGNEEQFVKASSELFVVCADDVYSLIITPQHVPSQTIHLSNPHKTQITANIERYKELPLEKQILDLTQRVIKNDIPESFEVTRTAGQGEFDWHDDWLRDKKIAHYQDVRVPGVGLKIAEYLVKAEHKTILSEKMFLSTTFGPNIIGITIVGRTLSPNHVAHVYIVERVAV